MEFKRVTMFFLGDLGLKRVTFIRAEGQGLLSKVMGFKWTSSTFHIRETAFDTGLFS